MTTKEIHWTLRDGLAARFELCARWMRLGQIDFVEREMLKLTEVINAEKECSTSEKKTA